MKTLTANILIKALSELSEEERNRTLVPDYYQFCSMSGVKKTSDLLGMIETSQVSLVLSPSSKSIPKKERTVLLEFFPKSPDNPDYVIFDKSPGVKFTEFYKNAKKAGKKIRKSIKKNKSYNDSDENKDIEDKDDKKEKAKTTEFDPNKESDG